MYFPHTALTAVCIIILVNGQEGNNGSLDNPDDNENEDKQNVNTVGNNTFVALIDIVFVDDTKRTCTGAIVHDNIVVTAAHCFFGRDRLSPSKAELTASFVVIGTKKMFDTGYEQYIPIERVVVHPKYEGWTADLALVFTFAAMTSDKPGTIIPLAGDKMTAHLDSNITLFSWHPRQAEPANSLENKPDWKKYDKKNKNNAPSDDSCDSDEDKRHRSGNKRITVRNTVAMVMKRFRNNPVESTSKPALQRYKKKKNTQKYKNNANVHHARAQHEEEYSVAEMFAKKFKQSSIISRYLTIGSSAEKIESSINPYVFGTSESNEKIEKYLRTKGTSRYSKTHRTETTRTIIFTKQTQREKKSYKQPASRNKEQNKKPRVLYSFKTNNDWRRSMGSTQNRLAVENFVFTNLQSCRALVDKALPEKYNISKHQNDVVCYTSAERCVDESDSGALAVRQGALVAITVGGVECDGEHVAVGMRMACFCSWVSDNLPPGSTPLQCCKNCCDVLHKEEKRRDRRHRYGNKFI